MQKAFVCTTNGYEVSSYLPAPAVGLPLRGVRALGVMGLCALGLLPNFFLGVEGVRARTAANFCMAVLRSPLQDQPR